MSTVRGYHFVGAKLRDGSPVPPDGEWLTYDGACKMCESGLHASRQPFDALQYAPSATLLCLVDCEQIEAEQDDKLVCHKRRIVARFDAADMMREFSRWCALQVIHLWDAPQVVRDYLTTGDESLWSAAGAAARDVAWSSARNAAWDAARDAQRAKFEEMVDARFASIEGIA